MANAHLGPDGARTHGAAAATTDGAPPPTRLRAGGGGAFSGEAFAVRIRPATTDDLPVINAIYSDEVVTSTATWDLEPMGVGERAQWLQAHPPGRYPVLVADVEGAVAAWACLSPYSQRGGWGATVECSVYVGAGYRGRGLGPALLDAICAVGAHLGHAVVLARISADNEASLRMCAREGFFEVGRMLGVGTKFGRTLDCVILQRFLRRRAGAVVRDDAGRVLFIRRERDGAVWWILPGGTVEPAEAPEAAAVREVLEETGVEVRLGALGYRIFRHGRLQLYYQASFVRQVHPSGMGPEFAPGVREVRGTYTAEWLSTKEVGHRACLPPPVARAIVAGSPWPSAPETHYDDPVPTAAHYHLGRGIP